MKSLFADAAPMIGFGPVRHTRLRPRVNAFAYQGYFLMLPMRALQQRASAELARNRSSWLSFHDADHGDGRGPEKGGALAWLDELLHKEGIAGAEGEVWLQCYPRVFGYTFKPVSFWYCHDRAGALQVIVVEVNNTFGERHCYLLPGARYGQQLEAAKVFHVSPFCPVEGGYRFRFMHSASTGRLVARVDYDDALGALIQTSISGQLETLGQHSRRKAFWQYPALTLGVVFRIHWQALRLSFMRTPWFRKPRVPPSFVTR